MPKSGKPLMLDGLSSVRAVTRHATDAAEPVGSATRRIGSQRERAEAAAGKFQQTVVPVRNEIVCYHCGYAFAMHGKLTKVFCAKCRLQLATDDRHIEGEWKDDVRTLGIVTIEPAATLDACELVAGEVRIAGDARRAGRIVCRMLTLEPGGQYDMTNIEPRSILVNTGARLASRRTVQCRNLAVRGTVKAVMVVAETTCIHDGGVYQGRLNTFCLRMEDGATLEAALSIGAQQGDKR